MKALKILGLVLFIFSLLVFTLSMFKSEHKLTEALLTEHIGDESHRTALTKAANDSGIFSKSFGTNLSFISAMNGLFAQANNGLDSKIPNWQKDKYLVPLTKFSTAGPFGGRTNMTCLLYTSPSPRDATLSRMPSSA